MKTKEMNIDDIKVGERFREDMGGLDDLAASIKAFGVLQPISIDEADNLLAGGRRLEASRRAGLQNIPVVVQSIRDEIDAREIELAENIFRKDLTWQERAKLEGKIYKLRSEKDSEWTMAKQGKMLDQSTSASGRRIQLAEMIENIPELETCKTEDEAWKLYKRVEEGIVIERMKEKADTSPSKISLIVEKYYIIGDARAEIEKVKSRSLDFAEVDPPYAIDLTKRKSRSKGEPRVIGYNEIDQKDYADFIEKIAQETYRVLKPNAFCVWWFGYQWYIETYAVLSVAGFHLSETPGIWVKGISGQTASPDTQLGSSYEPFFVCRKGEAKLRKAGRSNVFQYTPTPPSKKIHPTERPIELMLDIIETFTFPGSSIIVPFLGSGVTLRAALFQQCTGFGYDLDEMCRERFIRQARIDMEEE